MITGKYPSLRLRRSRKNEWSRRLIEENTFFNQQSPNDFKYFLDNKSIDYKIVTLDSFSLNKGLNSFSFNSSIASSRIF